MNQAKSLLITLLILIQAKSFSTIADSDLGEESFSSIADPDSGEILFRYLSSS